MVLPALEQAPSSLRPGAYNWACDIKNALPDSALNAITSFEALNNAKHCMLHLRSFSSKCYADIDEKKPPCVHKLEPRSIEGHLVGYRDSGNMFHIYFLLRHKVETVPQGKFEPSSYATVDAHAPSRPSNLAEHPPTIIQGLLPEPQ